MDASGWFWEALQPSWDIGTVGGVFLLVNSGVVLINVLPGMNF